MPNYLFIYRSEPSDASQVSPEQMQESMERWGKWIEQGFREGWMVEPGDALLPEGRVVDAQRVLSDGPFVESKEVVGGYSVVKAATIDEAVKYARSCPHTLEGGKTEVRTLAGLSASSG